MTVNLFTFVAIFSRVLDTAAHILEKGSTHAAATGVSEPDFLDWRLIDDMFPLRVQFVDVVSISTQWLARAADRPVPAGIDGEPTVAEMQAAIADAKAYLATFTVEDFSGRDDAPLMVKLGNGVEPTVSVGQWVSVYATTNLFFHLSTAYGIMRSKGVQIGKLDLFSGGL